MRGWQKGEKGNKQDLGRDIGRKANMRKFEWRRKRS